ncbi:DNA primase family protein [Lacticaseibacillus saniviri]
MEQEQTTESLVPIDLRQLSGPNSTSKTALAEYNQQIEKRIPHWLHARVKFVGENGDGQKRIVTDIRVDNDAYAKDLLTRYPIIRTPDYPEGVGYVPSTGIWRRFAKGEFGDTTMARIQRELGAWGFYNIKEYTEINTIIKNMTYKDDLRVSDTFDRNKHPEYVAVKNGVYDILRNKMLPKSPDNYLTNYHDLQIHPEINDCPETQRQLAAMVGKDTVLLVMQVIGYMYYDSYRPFPIIVCLSGSGGEGKSTLIAKITNLLGNDNVAAAGPSLLADTSKSFVTSCLQGKELNVFADIDSAPLTSTAMLKSLTGGDLIFAERKHQQPFSFENYAKLLFAGNQLPAFRDVSKGIADRFRVIEFINGDTRGTDFWDQFDGKKIESEMPAFATALRKGRLSVPESVRRASAKWLLDNDSFARFLSENYVIIPGDDQGEPVRNVRADYRRWCQRQEVVCNTKSHAITSRLQSLGIQRLRSIRGYTENANVWRYIGLRRAKNID